jgi:hypothetical protein
VNDNELKQWLSEGKHFTRLWKNLVKGKTGFRFMHLGKTQERKGSQIASLSFPMKSCQFIPDIKARYFC